MRSDSQSLLDGCLAWVGVCLGDLEDLHEVSILLWGAGASCAHRYLAHGGRVTEGGLQGRSNV